MRQMASCFQTAASTTDFPERTRPRAGMARRCRKFLTPGWPRTIRTSASGRYASWCTISRYSTSLRIRLTRISQPIRSSSCKVTGRPRSTIPHIPALDWYRQAPSRRVDEASLREFLGQPVFAEIARMARSPAEGAAPVCGSECAGVAIWKTGSRVPTGSTTRRPIARPTRRTSNMPAAGCWRQATCRDDARAVGGDAPDARVGVAAKSSRALSQCRAPTEFLSSAAGRPGYGRAAPRAPGPRHRARRH